MVKKEVGEYSFNDAFGIISLNFGILSLVFSVFTVIGISLGVIGLVFGRYQQRKKKSLLAAWGMGLSGLGVIVGLAILIWIVPQVAGGI